MKVFESYGQYLQSMDFILNKEIAPEDVGGPHPIN